MAQGNRYNEPFFWHRIVNVGWAGAVTIVQVTAVEIKSYDVFVSQPDDSTVDSFGGATITQDDYKDKFMVTMESVGNLGSVVVEDEIHPWVWDGFFTGAIGDEPFNSSQVAAGTAMFGYAPPVHLTGSQVKRNQLNPPFGTHDLGDVVNHTHPNGSGVQFRQGYTPITHGPVGEPPVGDVDFSGTESWYWYRVTTDPESTAAVRRKSYLFNFRTNFAIRGVLQDYPMSLDHAMEWSIRGFSQGASFTIADGVMTPVGGLLPKYSASGASPGSHGGIIRQFGSSGFVEE